MHLQHLCSAHSAEVYFDKTNGWAFVDWVGELTLEAVQRTCLDLARCFLKGYYPRVLNSNAQVTGASREVSAWLASEFLPALSFTGIEQMAWVVASGLRTHNQVLDAVNLFPHTAISLFDDVDGAVAWLQQTAPAPLTIGPAPQGRSYADECKLRNLVEVFAQRLAAASAS